MPEKKPKKVSFTEQDAATLTQRYDATTVLTLLQEVAQYPHAKIDWNELVKKTSTGISNAREYQMLWRHLAYHDALVENLEDGAEPLDDDSDLECELEVSPPVSAESASEAAACVKRWSILRKKDGSSNSGAILTNTPYTSAEQLATRHSLSLALDMPFKKLTAPGTADHARTSLNMSSKSLVQHNTTEASTICSRFVPNQQLMPKGNSTPNPAIKATAVAYGARIVSPSNTTSHLKVAQARNTALTTSSSLPKSSTPTGLPSEAKVQVCTGSSAAPVPSQSAVAITSPTSCTSTVKTVYSNPSPARKEKVQNYEKLIQDKSMNIPVKEGTTSVMGSTRSEEVKEGSEVVKGDKAVSKNQVVCEDQGNMGSPDLDQEKSKNSINGSSQDQNLNVKEANLQN